MEILTRAQAAAKGQSQYFTGKPCKNGHTAYRYTQSGTCSTCIAQATTRARENLAESLKRTPPAHNPRPGSSARRAAAVDLVELRVRAYAGRDVAMLQELAAVLCIQRYPTLTPADVQIRAQPTDAAGGTALYRLRVPDSGVALVRETAAALLNAHAVNLAAFHKAQAARAEAMAPTESQPEWAFA